MTRFAASSSALKHSTILRELGLDLTALDAERIANIRLMRGHTIASGTITVPRHQSLSPRAR
jgi:hypothetical protein